MNGLYVAIEGIDGSGTTTVAEAVAEELSRNKSRDVYCVREPSDGEIGVLIRRALTTPGVVERKALLYMFVADRIDLVERTVVPLLKQGAIVISDRCYLSTLCYQMTEGHSLDKMLYMHEGTVLPRRIFYLRVPVSVAAERRGQRPADTTQVYERGDLLHRVRGNYERAYAYGHTLHRALKTVDATHPLDKVVRECVNAINFDYASVRAEQAASSR